MSLPIVFINLDRDAERRTRLLAELQSIDMPSERFPAVWWADVPPEQTSRWYSDALNARQYYKPLRNGEKGCYASHIGAWRQLLASDAPALVVLEDDVRLTPQFTAVIEAIAALGAASTVAASASTNPPPRADFGAAVERGLASTNQALQAPR